MSDYGLHTLHVGDLGCFVSSELPLVGVEVVLRLESGEEARYVDCHSSFCTNRDDGPRLRKL